MSGESPGRAAYEAYIRATAQHRGELLPDYGIRLPAWDDFPPALHAAWAAAAVAATDAHAMTGILTAVKADSGDTVVIAFNRPVSAQLAHEVHERWSVYAPGVTIVLVDDAAAVQAYKP